MTLPVGVAELFVAVLVAGVGLLNAGLPLAAWTRSHDSRFLLLAGSNVALAALGAVWLWGQLPVSPPAFAHAELPVLSIALVVVLLGLAATLWPRRA